VANFIQRFLLEAKRELDPYQEFAFHYEAMEELLDRFLEDESLHDEPEVRGLQEALEAFDGVRMWRDGEC